MALYRVINGDGFKEAEFKIYSSAMAKADELHTERGDHYRVEEVCIVYHTAQSGESHAERTKD